MGERTPLLDRFWAKVEKTSSCWLWRGRVNKLGDLGYGSLAHDGRAVYVHRLSYEVHVGPIPEGHVVDHLCRVRRCVNPAHLEAVTQAENVVRGIGPSLRKSERHTKTHCPKGHPYDEANSYIEPKSQHRVCRICKRAKERAAYARRRITASR